LRLSLPSLSVVRGWHAPAGRRPVEPRPLAQARQIGPAAPVGAERLGPGRRAGIKTTRTASSRIAGQTGSQPDPTPVATPTHGSTAEALPTSSLPYRREAGANHQSRQPPGAQEHRGQRRGAGPV